MNQKTLVIASCALTAAASFLVGRATSPSSPESTAGSPTDTPPPRSDRPSTSGGSDMAKSFRGKNDPRASRTSPTDVDRAVEEMIEIMGTTDPLARTEAWLAFVNGLDPARFEEVVDQFRSKGLTDGNMTEYAMMLTAWAKADPLAALDYASENTGTSFARNTILTSWATTDPNGAIQWAESNHDGDGANPWMVGVIRGVAANDPFLATQLMGDMPYSEERGQALTAIMPQILKQGPDAAREWATSITDERLQAGAIRRMAENLARTDPAGTADWLASNPGEAATGAMDNVLGTWARQDMDAAKSYYQSLPAGELRSSALRGISNQLAMSDPQAAADLIDSNPGDASDRVYQQFVWHSFREDPSIAANYIGRIEDVETRDSTYSRMLDGWLRRDFDAASTWLGSNPVPDEVAKRLERRMEQMQQRQQ